MRTLLISICAIILLTSLSTPYKSFAQAASYNGSNLQMLQAAFDSTLLKTPITDIQAKKVLFEYEGKDEYKPIILPLLVEHLKSLDKELLDTASRDMIDKVSTIELEVLALELSYPKAYREGLFGARKLEKEITLSSAITLKDKNKVLDSKILDCSVTREIAFIDKEVLEQEFPQLTGEVEGYSLLFYLWEPVVLTVITTTLVYLTFSNR